MEKIYVRAEFSWTHRQDVTFCENDILMHRGQRVGKFSGNKRASKNTIFGTSYHTVSQKVEIFHIRSIWPIFVFTIKRTQNHSKSRNSNFESYWSRIAIFRDS